MPVKPPIFLRRYKQHKKMVQAGLEPATLACHMYTKQYKHHALPTELLDHTPPSHLKVGDIPLSVIRIQF